jgi:hypothetical protein
MMQHHFPEEWLTLDDMYCQGPQGSHNTVVHKIVAKCQEKGKSRNKGYLYNSNHLTWSESTEGFNEERYPTLPNLDGEYTASSTARRKNCSCAAPLMQKIYMDIQ